ncbi:MAG: hypothetical protein ABI847_19035 [Anaerolineales bacterium]
MNPYEPFGKKPASSGSGAFRPYVPPAGQKPAYPIPGAYVPFGSANSQKPAVYSPFGAGNTQKPPVSAPLFTSPKPAVNPPGAFRSFGATSAPKPKRNFWGDMDDDGKETSWDDMLGDGLLGDAMLAQQRAQQGQPAEPEDEFLIGRRPTAQRRPAAGAASAPVAFFAVLFGLGLAAFICYSSLLGG